MLLFSCVPRTAIDKVKHPMLNDCPETSETRNENRKKKLPKEVSNKREPQTDSVGEALEEGKQPESFVDTFGSPNHSPNVIRMMASVASPRDSSILHFAGRDIHVKLPSSWHNLEVKESNSGRRLGKGWTDILLAAIYEQNKECCWIFKRNYIEVTNSRKHRQGQRNWFGSTICKFKSCQTKITMCISNASDDVMIVRYSKNPTHDGNEIKSRKMGGEVRTALANKFLSNPTLKPSMEYSERLGKLDPDQYASGNRTGPGLSANAFRIISSRAKIGHRTINGLEKD